MGMLSKALRDVGRSNIGQVGQSMFNDVLKYKQAERQDAMDAVSIAHQARQEDIQRQGLAIQQAEEARRAKVAAEREVDLNKVVDLTVSPMFLSLPEEHRPAVLKYFADNGYSDATGRGRKVDLLNGVDTIEKSKTLFSQFIGPSVEARKQRVVESWNGLQDASRTGDQAKIDAAKANYEKEKMAYQASSGKFHEHLNRMDELEIQNQSRAAIHDEDALYRSKTLAETIRHNRVVESKADGSAKLDLEGARALIKTLPKLKEEAVSASGNLQRIDEMTSLLDKGFGGRLGQAKAWLAPWAEAAGMDIKGLSEAQTYELLAQTLGGSMRMAIVGPGQVSNFEQQMLQKVNAGGRAATPAARELLKYYRDIAARKVNDYNDSVDSVADVSPATAKLYKRITGGGVAAPAAGGGVTTAEEFLRKKGLK